MTAAWKMTPALIAALTLTLFVAGCSQDDESPATTPAAVNEAPELPPADVMTVDLSALGAAEAQGAAKVKTDEDPAASD